MDTPRLFRNSALFEALTAALIALLMSLAVFGPILKWIAVGWSGGDMLSTYVNVEVWQGFSYRVTDQFGFPLGMNLNYFPGIDITENTFAALVSNLVGTPFIGINVLVLITFPLVAFLAYFLFRMTGLTGALAIAGAVTFSLIPFHFGRALGHTYLATLYSAVTGLALVLLVGSGGFERIRRQLNSTALSKSRNVWLAIAVIGLIVVTAWTGVYYAAFTLILGAAALLWRFAKGATWRAVAWDATPFVAITVMAFLGFLPSILATISDPPVGVLSSRLPYDSVVFAGYLAVLILPMPTSLLPGFDFYNRSVSEAIAAGGWVESSAQSNFGTWITTAALLTLLGGLIANARARHGDMADATARNPVSAGFITYLLVVCFLFFIPWGLNYLVAGTVTAQIRAWNRLTPIVLLLFLLGAAAVLRNSRVARPGWTSLVIAGVVLTLTFVDAVLPFRDAYADNAQKGAEITKAGREYAVATNIAIPGNCGILQLPTMGYPEFGVIGNVNDYDHFWTSITNAGKQWSYGAVKETDAYVWAGQLPQVPTDEQVALMRGAGFCGIHLDTRAWRDEQRPEIAAELTRRFGKPAASGNDRDWLLFDIRGVLAAPAPDVENFLHQPMIAADAVTTYPRESIGTESWWWTRDQDARFILTPTRESSPVSSVRGWIAAPPCGPRPVTLTFGSGTDTTQETIIAKPDEPTTFRMRIEPPFTTPVTFEVFAPGAACESGEFTGQRFAQVGSLQAY